MSTCRVLGAEDDGFLPITLWVKSLYPHFIDVETVLKRFQKSRQRGRHKEAEIEVEGRG